MTNVSSPRMCVLRGARPHLLPDAERSSVRRLLSRFFSRSPTRIVTPNKSMDSMRQLSLPALDKTRQQTRRPARRDNPSLCNEPSYTPQATACYANECYVRKSPVGRAKGANSPGREAEIGPGGVTRDPRDVSFLDSRGQSSVGLEVLPEAHPQ